MTKLKSGRRIASLDSQTFVVRCSCCRKYCSVDRLAIRHVFRCGGCGALVQVGRLGDRIRFRQNPATLFIGFSPEEISYHQSNPRCTRRPTQCEVESFRWYLTSLDQLSVVASVLGIVSLVSTCALICAKLMR